MYTMGVILRPPGDHGPVWWLKAAQTQCDRGPFQKQGHLSLSSLWSQPGSGVKLCTSKCSTSKGKLGSFSFFNLLFSFSSFFFSLCKTQFLLLRQHFCQALTFYQRVKRIKPQLSYRLVLYQSARNKTFIFQKYNNTECKYSWLSNSLLLLCTDFDSRLCSSKYFSERSDTFSCFKSLFAYSCYFNLSNLKKIHFPQ